MLILIYYLTNKCCMITSLFEKLSNFKNLLFIGDVNNLEEDYDDDDDDEEEDEDDDEEDDDEDEEDEPIPKEEESDDDDDKDDKVSQTANKKT